MRLYNTESRQKEEIVPLRDNQIRLYTCGPTVYNFAHIGNFRTYVFEDLLRRALKYFGFEVIQVQNITDIDDKTLAGAIHEKKKLREYTDPYAKAFFDDLNTLHIEPAEHYPHATDYIPQMIELIQKLVDRGLAYRGADESIYFSIHKFPGYGRLSHLNMDELKAGASRRVGTDEYDKENVSDFVLWKAYDYQRDGEIFWESPFGKGRPGWHIECSAMAMSLLGETIDIHVGGVDNMFPHHENEIAQSEGCSGKCFVKHWLHAEHLLVDHRKMSKSLGNFYTLRDLLKKGYTGTEVRMLLLSAHYRTQLNFTMEGLDAARTTRERLSDFVDRLKSITQKEKGGEMEGLIATSRNAFKDALADDLNISQAFAALFEYVRKVNQLCDNGKVGEEEAQTALRFLKELDRVLAIIPFERQELEIPQELTEALEKREEARKTKNWAEADKQRDVITAAGYLIEDTPSGPRLKKK
ncbi:MAG: cysteine--tRNA ligase [Verrucomicrobia bacterium]|nr:cysteine--tRNA ligase [Verrucomicrobiota bacterium]